jgi:hypothetical protein
MAVEGSDEIRRSREASLVYNSMLAADDELRGDAIQALMVHARAAGWHLLSKEEAAVVQAAGVRRDAEEPTF